MRRFGLLSVTVLLLASIILMPKPGLAQGKRVRWKRRTPAVRPELQLFHSPHLVSLPTATTLQKGDFEFEISHRFIPPINSGYSNLYGLDGPVNMRIALGYAPTNRLVVTLGRSNVDGNVDLWLKYKLLQRRGAMPLLLAIQAGSAWNTLPADKLARGDSRHFQYWGELILNTLIHKRLGIGLVPSYLYNTSIYLPERQHTVNLGIYGQFYVSPLWSLLVEWNAYLSGEGTVFQHNNDAISFGFELETGGHFFKIFLTNSQFLNASQYLAGADLSPSNGDWRLGFMITRLLKFGKPGN